MKQDERVYVKLEEHGHNKSYLTTNPQLIIAIYRKSLVSTKIR